MTQPLPTGKAGTVTIPEKGTLDVIVTTTNPAGPSGDQLVNISFAPSTTYSLAFTNNSGKGYY